MSGTIYLPTTLATQLRRVARAEVTKLRTLRSTWWTAGFAVVINLSIASLAAHFSTAGDSAEPVSTITSGYVLSAVALSVLGALVITSEYNSGTIRLTMSATPQRSVLLIGKGIAVSAWTTAVGIASMSGGILLLRVEGVAGSLSSTAISVRLTYAVLLPVLIGLIALGLGAATRSTVATVVIMGVVFFGGEIIGVFLPEYIARFIPVNLVYATSRLGASPPEFNATAAWLILIVYAALICALGWVAFDRRDA